MFKPTPWVSVLPQDHGHVGRQSLCRPDFSQTRHASITTLTESHFYRTGVSAYLDGPRPVDGLLGVIERISCRSIHGEIVHAINDDGHMRL